MDQQLVDRVKVLMQELNAIRGELSRPAINPATGLAEPRLPADTLLLLQREVDQVRFSLWAYIDTWSVGGDDPAHRLKQIRMEKVASMLQQLNQEFLTKGIPATGEGLRLADEVRALAPLTTPQRKLG